MSDVQQALAELLPTSPGVADVARVETIRQHIAALTAEVEALRRDAERWRFLRQRLFLSDVQEAIFDYPTGTNFNASAERDACRIEHAIDAARHQEATNVEGS